MMRVTHLCVDLSEASRCLIHAKAQFPVKPDTVARFTTPLWIQESHKNNGPVAGIAGLQFYCWIDEDSIIKQELLWKRDPCAPSRYQVNIPPGVHTIYACFDAIITRNVSRRIVMFGWEHALLHPINHHGIDEMPIQASVTVPAGWGIATALQNLGAPTAVASPHERTKSLVETYNYNPTTVRRLADSPVLAGLYLRNYTLTDTKAEILCVAADRDMDTQIHQQILSKLSSLITQTLFLFGPRPGTASAYFFLVALSDFLPNVGGSEHFDSSAVILPSTAFSDIRLGNYATILAHEFIHAWNGKYRRPMGHNPPDFSTPLDGRLLWVYEGLTQYYEGVLSARASVLSKDSYLRELAEKMAWLEGQRGREWRSVEDTGTGVSVGGIGMAWANWMREKDYYCEGEFLWLDVDTLLRIGSGGTKSLDDFMKAFFQVQPEEGVEIVDGRGDIEGADANDTLGKEKRRERRLGRTPSVVEYALEDIVNELGKLLPSHDWEQFFRQRIIDVSPEVNADGLERAGYRFLYAGNPQFLGDESMANHIESQPHETDFDDSKMAELKNAIWNSLGVQVAHDGLLEDVRCGGPADIAMLAPRQRITGVLGGSLDQRCLGTPFNIVDLGREISRAYDKGPIRFSMAQEYDEWVVEVDYRNGLRYPLVERSVDKEDILERILRPRLM